MYINIRRECEKTMEPGSFSVVPSDRIRGNRHKLKHRAFPLNIWKHSFTVRVTDHWHSLPGEAMESPFPKIFKSYLNMGK